jgi:hypothetical protein
MYRNIRCDRWSKKILEAKPELSYRFHAWAVVERRGGRSWQDVTLACPSRGIESIAHESLTHKLWLIVRWFVADKPWLTDLVDKLKRTGPELTFAVRVGICRRGVVGSLHLQYYLCPKKSNYGIHISQKSSSLTKFIANIISIYVSKQI